MSAWALALHGLAVDSVWRALATLLAPCPARRVSSTIYTWAVFPCVSVSGYPGTSVYRVWQTRVVAKIYRPLFFLYISQMKKVTLFQKISQAEGEAAGGAIERAPPSLVFQLARNKGMQKDSDSATDSGY